MSLGVRSLFRWLLGAALICSGLGTSPHARAEDRVTLHWRGEEHCSPPTDANAEIGRLLGERYAQLEPVAFDVEVERTGDGVYTLSLRFAEAAEDTRRTLRLASCSEVREAAVLLAAMALDPSLAIPELPPAPPETPPPPPPRPEPPTKKAPGSLRPALILGGVVDVWSLPHPGGGPDLAGRLGFRALQLGVHARYLSTTATRSGLPAHGEAQFQLLGGALELGASFGWGRLRLGPTSELEAGWLWGRASGVRSATQAGAPWLSGWAGIAGELALSRRIALFARGLAGLPLLRPRFALHGEPAFYTAPPYSLRFFLGVSFTFGPTG